jgi:hypothetical protein
MSVIEDDDTSTSTTGTGGNTHIATIKMYAEDRCVDR